MRGALPALCMIGALWLAACASDPSSEAAHASGGASGTGHAGSGAGDDFGNAGASGTSGTSVIGSGGGFADASFEPLDGALPDDFIAADIGGYKLGAALSSDDAIDTGLGDQAADQAAGTGCATMVGVVRDFHGANDPDGHPDFEAYKGRGATPGLLAQELGADHKPIYASHCEADPGRDLCPYDQQTTSEQDFASWYRTTPGINLPYLVHLHFVESEGVYTFESKAFFPLDDAGFGNSGGKRQHNFGFTTEIHTQFLYTGGEHFTFTGDDDLWVFVNGQLAIDLGGLHPPESAELDLDAQAELLGIEPGETYTLDLFHAERHSASSNFRVDTTLAFTDCGHVTVELL